MPTERTVEEHWYQMLTEGEPINRHLYHLYGLLPSDPRCKMCAAPFGDLGGFIIQLLGRDQSKYNPHFCQPCEKFDHPGGAAVVVSMLFADIRGLLCYRSESRLQHQQLDLKGMSEPLGVRVLRMARD